MNPAQLELLRALCETAAPAGREGAMVERMRHLFASAGADPCVDWLGNVTARFGGDGAAILFHAHMDEIGFVVRTVTADGFLRVERLGGVGRRSALGSPVSLLARGGVVEGVVGLQSHHLASPSEQFTVPPVEDWYLDIGAESAEAVAALGVGIGTFAAFAPNFRELGSSRVSSKALDNRVGCWVLAELARRFSDDPPRLPVALLANVQEEFHLRGLIPAVTDAKPEVAVGLDITPAADTPDLIGRNSIRLGAGPAVKIMDFHGRGSLNGLLVPERLVEWIESAAASQGIETQREVVVGVVTDGTYLPSLGIPSAAVSIPARYTHSPCEVVSLSDVLRAADLCEALARGERPSFVQ
ncbi:M42 family metallopeptidase [Candidatus Poribacteria bacterium]|nr:M42 family metallopeptidase [Candidatus Poribacteria bacterium]